MYNLLYSSSATIPFNQTGLEDLLGKARQNNSKKGITGLLLYSDGSFVQLLEGEEEQVRSTFDVIAKDDRHNNIELVVAAPSDTRYFPSWQMGFKWLSKDDLKRIEEHGSSDIKNYFKTSEPYKLIKLMSIGHWNF